MNKNKHIKIFVFCSFFICICLTGCVDYYEYATGGEDENVSFFEKANNTTVLSIANWNLQVFGPSKASNDTLLRYYADHIDDYDIIVIQEIRDASGVAIEKLAMQLPEYEYVISKRAGQSISKEQYAVFYNHRVNITSIYDYTNEYQNQINRPPFQIVFTADNWTFSLYTIHTDPDEVDAELSIVETILSNETTDIILIGDLNADGIYYDEDNINHFRTWHWVIPNQVDTTVALSNNTYDRIIVNEEAIDNVLEYGIMNSVAKVQSDHYLIYALFDSSRS